MTRRLWLAVLALALTAPVALASAPRGASRLELAPPPLAIERSLAADERSRFPLGLESVDAAPPRLAPLVGVQLLDEDLAAELARGRQGAEPSYPRTRIGGLRLFGQNLDVVSTPVSVDVRWGCGNFSCVLAEGIGSWLSEDPAGTVDSPSLYAFVGNRPNLATDPLGLQELPEPGTEEYDAYETYARARAQGSLALRRAGQIAGGLNTIGEGVTDLGPGIGPIKLASFVFESWNRGDRRPAYLLAGTVGGTAAISILARRYARLHRVGAKAVDEIDAATLAAERSAAATVNRAGDEAARFTALYGTQFSRNVRAYLSAVERQTGFRIHPAQRTHLAESLRTTKYSRLSPKAGRTHRSSFRKVKDSEIAEWERQTGQSWPRYQAGQAPPGRKAGDYYDAHHVIENIYAGPHEWWNLTPARFPESHQGGIHLEEIMEKLFP